MSLRPESWRPWTEPRAIAVVVICAAAVWCTSIVVGGWKATHGNDTPRTIDVTGEASRHVVPEHASWSITVRGNAETRDASVKAARDLADTMRKFLKGHGIADAEIAVKQPETDGDLLQDDGTAASSFGTSVQLVVESSDAAKVMKVYDEASNTEGLDADMENPTCTSASNAKLEAELLTEARHNARAKAEAALADYGGAQVGRLVHAEVGDFSAGDDCGGADATATATATYELE
jgi:hypothetical protein